MKDEIRLTLILVTFKVKVQDVMYSTEDGSKSPELDISLAF